MCILSRLLCDNFFSIVSDTENRVNNNVIASSRRAVDGDKESEFIPMSLEKPSGLNMEDFLPVIYVCWTFCQGRSKYCLSYVTLFNIHSVLFLYIMCEACFLSNYGF